MKATKFFLLGAAILTLATSCKDLLDSMAKNPVFTFAGTTVYDGQSAYLGTTATCRIGWTNHNPEIVDLSYNEIGKECIATFRLPDISKKTTKVKITATNLEDETVEPFVGEITVEPWRLGIYKKGSNGWNSVDALYNPSTASFSYGAAGNGAGTYKIQLETKDNYGNYTAITSIPYNLGKLEQFKVRWSGKLIGINGSAEEAVYSKEFTLESAPASGSNRAVAYLGEVGYVITVSK
jgi:hypothetical protein